MGLKPGHRWKGIKTEMLKKKPGFIKRQRSKLVPNISIHARYFAPFITEYSTVVTRATERNSEGVEH
jgi:hypothetical protein